MKLLSISQDFPPEIELCYDAQTVGRQADGSWQTWSQPRIGQLLRSLHRWIEHKFQVELKHSHVHAHQGEPGNELVDVLAYQAADGKPLHDLQPWLDTITDKAFVESVEWVWYLFRTDLKWDGSSVRFPAGPKTTPKTSVLETGSPSLATFAHDVTAQLDVKLATCNVLSLKPPCRSAGADDVGVLCAGPARQDSLLRQFHEAGIHIFAWQETRIKRCSNQHDDRYWLFRSPATAQGHFGIIIGLHRLLPIGTIGTEKIFLKEHEVSVVTATPRVLILRLSNPLMKCILIAAHAPHTGAEMAYIADWWKELAASIPAKYQHLDRVLLTDANARVGSEPNAQIGDHQAEAFDCKAEGFLNFVCQQGLWIPSTFAQFHHGLGMTWRHARGQWHRNDFVCISMSWSFTHCASWVSQEIDVGLAKDDHCAAIVHIKRDIRPSPAAQPCQKMKLNVQDVMSCELSSLQKPSWEADVHTHAAELQQSLVDELWEHRVKPKAKPKRATMTGLTWQLVQEKRSCRNLLHERAKEQRRTILSAWFACWKHGIHDCSFDQLALAFDALIVEQDRLVAVAYHQFRRLGVQVVKALRADDIGFFSGLLQDCTEFLLPKDVKHLWKIVRRSLPKFQQRRLTVPPCQLEGLEDQWLPHFAELEAGVVTTSDQLVNGCVFEQALRRLDAPFQVRLSDLPGLTQLEQAFRATTAGKATGFDPLPSELFHRAAALLATLFHDLVIKEFAWQSEPVQDKGGPVALIPKTLHPSTAKQFRGILLLPSAGKRTHAILRSQIMKKLEITRAPGQLGGFPGQQVLYGSHAIRTFGTICDEAGLNCAILFLDLASAFHHLI